MHLASTLPARTLPTLALITLTLATFAPPTAAAPPTSAPPATAPNAPAPPVAAPTEPKPIAHADWLRIAEAITAGRDTQAAALLAAAVPTGRWCEAPLADAAGDAAPRIHADFAVLARRTRALDELGTCLFASLARAGTRRQAAALYEVAQLAPSLTPEERRTLHAALLRAHGPHDLRGPCLPPELGPLSWIDCALVVDDATFDPKATARTLLMHAAELAPRPAYVQRLDLAAAKEAGAFAAPLRPLPGARFPDRERAIEAAVARLAEAGGDPQTLQSVTQASGPWWLLDLRVYQRDSAPYSVRNALLLWQPEPAAGGLVAFDLGGLESDRMPQTLTVAAWDAEHGTLTVYIDAESDPLTEGSGNMRTTVLCQIDADGAPRCAKAYRSTWKFYDNGAVSLELVPHGQPSWRFEAGRLVAGAASEDYVHPAYGLLEGKTLAEAIALLPEVERTQRASLGHPVTEVKAE